MKTLIFIIILFTVNTAISQKIENLDSLITKIDTGLIFQHFKDKIIVHRYYSNKDKMNKVDTVYSCLYNSVGLVIAERIGPGYLGRIAGIEFFEYNLKNQKSLSIFYEEPENGLKLNSTTVKLYHYNNLDSLIRIEEYLYNKMLKPDFVEERRKIQTENWKKGLLRDLRPTNDSYTNNWELSYGFVLEKFYNSLNQNYLSKSFLHGEYTHKYISKFDSLNRLISQKRIEYSINEQGKFDSTLFNQISLKTFQYTDTSKIVIDTLRLGIPNANIDKNLYYYKDKKLCTHYEKWNYYGPNDSRNIGFVTKNYFRDTLDRIDYIIKVYENDTTIIDYIYKE